MREIINIARPNRLPSDRDPWEQLLEKYEWDFKIKQAANWLSMTSKLAVGVDAVSGITTTESAQAVVNKGQSAVSFA